jgi:hypothetical protein
MSDLSIDVERIVSEVLAQLSRAPSPAKGAGGREKGEKGNQGLVASATSKSPCAASTAPESAPQDSNTLVLNSRIITMNEVLGRLDAVRRVVVSRDAIVTPAVRDELLRRGIVLELADASTAHQSAVVRLALIATGTDFDSTALSAALAREGFLVEPSTSDCLIAAADQLAAEAAKPDTLCVLLTSHVAAALCLANRLRGVRAIRCTDPLAVAKTSAAVGANLLVADPREGGFFQLKQIITEFARGGVRPCPLVFRERLG